MARQTRALPPAWAGGCHPPGDTRRRRSQSCGTCPSCAGPSPWQRRRSCSSVASSSSLRARSFSLCAHSGQLSRSSDCDGFGDSGREWIPQVFPETHRHLRAVRRPQQLGLLQPPPRQWGRHRVKAPTIRVTLLLPVPAPRPPPPRRPRRRRGRRRPRGCRAQTGRRRRACAAD